MKDKYRNYLHLGLTAFLVIIASITFWFILNRFEVLHSIANKIFSILTPITYGAVMAFLVAPIYNRSTNFLNKFFKKKLIFLISYLFLVVYLIFYFFLQFFLIF